MKKFQLKCACCGEMLKMKGDESVGSFILWRLVCPKCNHAQFCLHKRAGGRVHEGTVNLHRAIHGVLADIEPPMTVRQVYYQLTVRKVVEKTDAGYDQVQRALTVMRRNGSISYSDVCDLSRDFYHQRTHRDMLSALDEMQRYYRRDLWLNQPTYVEIWLEKRALASQLSPICGAFGVKLYPMGGFASISFAYNAAMELREIEDKDIHIYHLSDLDADGAYSSISLEKELRAHAGNFHFHRLALSPSQVEEWRLHDSTREQKRTSRYGWWVDQYGDSQRACELDAIHPNTLRSIVHDAITRHIDPYEWESLKRIEAIERNDIARTIDMMRARSGN